MSAREDIARWLWAMDSMPGAKWDEWPDEHATYLAKADDYVGDTPWLGGLLADAERVQRVRELLRVWENVAQPGSVGTSTHALRLTLDGDA